MTTLDAYAAFLAARWDEQEADANLRIAIRNAVPEHERAAARRGLGGRSTERGFSDPAFLLSDLAAKRAVLQIAARYHRAGTSGMLEVGEYLAEPFRAHPDHPANADA